MVLSIAGGIGSIVVVHLLIFLQARGVDFATAVSLGTIFGPAQVGARLVERVFGNRYHPIWTMVASCTLMAIGLLLLYGAIPALILVILLYGAGYGISWVGRGTLPLALFGPVRFPRLMGKLAFPSLIIQALAPSAGALLLEANGAQATIGVLTVFATVNVMLIGSLWSLCQKPAGAQMTIARSGWLSCSLCAEPSERARPKSVMAKMPMAKRMRNMAGIYPRN